MANFDEILGRLHNSAILADTELDTPIVVNNKRKFEIPKDYNTIIAHEGDVNSQIVTFQLPLFHEGHKLSECFYKRIKWKNLKNGVESTSPLQLINVNENAKNFSVKWEVPPEAFSAAGKIEISLSLYDLDGGKIAFSWNTPTFSDLSVGAGFAEVGEDIESEIHIPAANEILFVDDE
jgi:hypothetical protein